MTVEEFLKALACGMAFALLSFGIFALLNNPF